MAKRWRVMKGDEGRICALHPWNPCVYRHSARIDEGWSFFCVIHKKTDSNKSQLSYGTKVPCAGHFCAITKLTFVGISFFMDYAKKTSPFIYSRGMPINTGVSGVKGANPPFITLHHPSSFCHFQIQAWMIGAWLMLLLRLSFSIKTSIRFLLRSCYGFYEACVEAQISLGRAFFNFCNFWTC